MGLWHPGVASICGVEKLYSSSHVEPRACTLEVWDVLALLTGGLLRWWEALALAPCLGLLLLHIAVGNLNIARSCSDSWKNNSSRL